jgi:hypothetical protein
MGNAPRNTFKIRLTQHDSRRQTDMGMHDIVPLRAKNPAEPKREGRQVGKEGAEKDTPAQGLDLITEACGRRLERTKVKVDTFAVNLPSDLQHPRVGATARYGPYDLEDLNWFVAHSLHLCFLCRLSEFFSATAFRMHSKSWRAALSQRKQAARQSPFSIIVLRKSLSFLTRKIASAKASG